MASKLVEIMDAAKTILDAADLSQEFTVERVYKLDYNLTDLATLKVTMFPEPKRALNIAGVSRTSSKNNYTFGVGIQKTVKSLAAFDAMLELPEEIIETIKANKRLTLASGLVASWQEVSESMPAWTDSQNESNVHTAYLAFTYSLHR